MDTIGKLDHDSLGCSVIVVIDRYLLTRTCVRTILNREFTSYDIIDIRTASDLVGFSKRDVRLIVFNISDNSFFDECIENELKIITKLITSAPVVLLAHCDDEVEASAAIARGCAVFFLPQFQLTSPSLACVLFSLEEFTVP